jgi:hypothetical protein
LERQAGADSFLFIFFTPVPTFETINQFQGPQVEYFFIFMTVKAGAFRNRRDIIF